MTVDELRDICRAEKEAAQALYHSSNGTAKYNAAQAINAWDELLGQMYKPRQIKKERFLKTKQTALRIVNLMKNSKYKKTQKGKIENLTIN